MSSHLPFEEMVEKYRSVHEPKHHWELKKKFMMKHRDSFEPMELVGLAQTFGNIEFLGCTYPPDTMKQIAELSRGIVEEYRAEKKGKLQRTFCSASVAANSKVNKTGNGVKRSSNEEESSSRPAKVAKYGNFVASSSQDHLQEKKIEGFVLPPQNPNKTPSKNFMNFCDKIVEDTKPENNESQPLGFKPNYKLQFEQHRREYEDSISSPNIRLQLNTSYPLHNFIVVTLDYVNDEPPTGVLQRSAGFCKMPVKWEYKDNGPICFITIDNQVVSESTGNNKADARDKAAVKAIEILQKHCYTILVKSQFLSDGTKVDLMDVQVNTTVGGKAESLGGGNIGHKLLSLMGWSGGGLGKGGAGISEPITAKNVFGREGLGSSPALGSTGVQFKKRITKIVEEWMSSNSPYDLVFTTGFSNDQRKDMHEVARRYGLKSKSYGKNEDRHLTISKKFSSKALVEELLRNGGETEKYKLIPPGGL